MTLPLPAAAAQGLARPKMGQTFQGKHNYRNAGQASRTLALPDKAVLEVIKIEMEDSVTFAKFKDIGKKNARRGSMKTNHAVMPKADFTGQEFI